MTVYRSLKNLKPVEHNDDEVIQKFFRSAYHKDEEIKVNHTCEERLQMFLNSPAGLNVQCWDLKSFNELLRKVQLANNNGTILQTR
jgi:hypothetical protein